MDITLNKEEYEHLIEERNAYRAALVALYGESAFCESGCESELLLEAKDLAREALVKYT